MYRTTTHVGARANSGVMEIRRVNGRLVAQTRDIGEDDVHTLHDVAVSGDTLTCNIYIPGPVPVRLVFDGVSGKGTWDDGGVKRGGATGAVKVR